MQVRSQFGLINSRAKSCYASGYEEDFKLAHYLTGTVIVAFILKSSSNTKGLAQLDSNGRHLFLPLEGIEKCCLVTSHPVQIYTSELVTLIVGRSFARYCAAT